MEPEEGIEKLQEALKVCKSYRNTYFDRRANLAQYFKEKPVVEWNFEPSLVFARLDRFTNQLEVIKVILSHHCQPFLCGHGTAWPLLLLNLEFNDL